MPVLGARKGSWGLPSRWIFKAQSQSPKPLFLLCFSTLYDTEWRKVEDHYLLGIRLAVIVRQLAVGRLEAGATWSSVA